MQRWGWNFTALKKITAGFITGAAAMAWAAAVQHYIYKVRYLARFKPDFIFDNIVLFRPAPAGTTRPPARTRTATSSPRR
jgi:hypothetical protein